MSESSGVRIFPPIYLLAGTDTCWRCQQPAGVFAMATDVLRDYDWDEHLEQFFILSYPRKLPQHVQEVLRRHAPTFYEDQSKAADSRYIMNHCRHCGAKLGDFYLHAVPGGAFWPTTRRDSRWLRVCRLPLDELSLECTFGVPEDSFMSVVPLVGGREIGRIECSGAR